MKELAIATLTYHILKGLKILHSYGYFHGNLKLENLVFCQNTKDKELYVINLRYLEKNTEEFRIQMLRKGSNYYVAPEILENKSFNEKSDLFSLGCCIFYMVTNQFPYKRIEYRKGKYTYEIDLSILEQIK